MTATKIEWTDATWNPVVGCSIVSPDCTHCYAMKMAARIERMGPELAHYRGLTRPSNAGAVWTGKVSAAPDGTLHAPLRWKKPRMVFVNSMSDLFHEGMPDEVIDRVFAVMALTPHHTYQVLTKRAERMREWFAERWQPAPAQRYKLGNLVHDVPAQNVGDDRRDRVEEACEEVFEAMPHLRDADNESQWNAAGDLIATQFNWPLPNVWLGVSTEDQRRAEERIPLLLETPAAVRWISAEPLLGPVDLTRLSHAEIGRVQALAGLSQDFHGDAVDIPSLDWVIAGGESGPKARPSHPDWFRALRDQCQAADVPFFFKQWGEWQSEIDRDNDDPDWRRDYSHAEERNRRILNLAGGCGFHGERVYLMKRVGKKVAGALLDGREHREWPR